MVLVTSKFKNDIYKIICSEMLGFSVIILRVLVSPTIKINNFGAQGHVRKSRKHENDGFSNKTLKSYKFKLKQNNATELLSISFP